MDRVAQEGGLSMFVMTIKYDDEQNQVSVDGPINNRLLAYGMLEMARDVIKDYTEKRRRDKIEIAASLSDLTKKERF